MVEWDHWNRNGGFSSDIILQNNRGYSYFFRYHRYGTGFDLNNSC